MTVIFFEDHLYGNFEPLSFSRPVYSLLCGTSKIYLKWLRALKSDGYGFLSRPRLSDIISLETGKKANVLPEGKILLINGRFIPSRELVREIEDLADREAIICDGVIVAFRGEPGKSVELKTCIENIHTRDGHDALLSLSKAGKVKAEGLHYLWDLINMNSRLIAAESGGFADRARPIDPARTGISLINPGELFVHESADIQPSVVIDASLGPVIVEENTKVEPFSYIQGPCYIGPDCRIVGGRIRSGSSFGPVCRVGGEVEESIMLGYCNKYHEGFLGHAYLGEWVNLGALTTNSDLKNNYKPISVEIAGKTVDSGSIKIGCFIGDHTKTGIGTMLNTGINIGFSCNLYGAGLFADKSIPSFSWGSPGNLQKYKLEKSIETAEISMARRNVKMLPAHKRLIEDIFNLE
jgi:UDP-N-acetylglucosamine diphosphorylase/glucosamine-1-phosphate N-acetyltransferase